MYKAGPQKHFPFIMGSHVPLISGSNRTAPNSLCNILIQVLSISVSFRLLTRLVSRKELFANKQPAKQIINTQYLRLKGCKSKIHSILSLQFFTGRLQRRVPLYGSRPLHWLKITNRPACFSYRHQVLQVPGSK